MKKHQAGKRKASKSTRIARMRARKAKQEQRRIAEEQPVSEPSPKGYINIPKPDAPPMSPARDGISR